MKKLEGKTAIVTGGARGIGAAIARELGREGATVIVNYNGSQQLAEAVAEEIKASGSLGVALQADVSKAASAQVLVEEVLKRFGRVDILVNNAGINRDRTFSKMSVEEWQEVVDTNLSSVFNTCKTVLPAMLEQKYGRIVNISSVVGQAGGFGQTNYAATKAGLIGFTKSLALETARKGVTVNAICPGFIATDMVAEMPVGVLETIIAQIPMRKLGEPAEVARGVVFVCESEYMTGQCLNLNGGLYML